MSKKNKSINKNIQFEQEQQFSFLQFIICAFVIIMPLLFCKWNDQSPFEMIKAYFSGFTVSMIAMFYLISMLFKSEIRLRLNFWIWGLFIYLSIYLLSFAFAGHSYSSLWGVLNLPAGSVMTVSVFVVFSFISSQVFSKVYSLKKLASCFVITAFIMSIYGIIQHFGGDPINWWVYGAMRERALSTMGQSVGYGTVLGCCLPLCFVFLISSETQKTFYFWLAAWTSMNLGILYSGSRLPILAYFVTMSIFTLFLIIFKNKVKNLSWKKIILALSLIILSNIAYYFDPNPNALQQRLEVSELKNAYGTRFIVWKTALELWKKNPILGVGPENFGEEFNHIQTVEQNYGESWNLIWHKAHNEFIHYLATTGSLGFAAYLLLIGLMFSPVLKTLFKKEWPKDYLFSVALLGGFGFLLVTHLTAFSFIPTMMFFYLFPAMNFNFTGFNQEFVFPNKLSKNWKYLLSAFVLTICTSVCVNIYQMWQSDIDYNESRRQLVSYGDIEKSYSFLNSAISQNPRNAEYWCFRADIYYNLFARAMRVQSTQIEQQRKMYYEEILNSSDKCVMLDPRKSDLWRARGTLFMTLTQFAPQLIEVSFEAFKKAIEVYPNNPYNYLSLSSVFIKKSRTDLAIDALKTALTKRNDLIPAYIELIKLYYQTDQKHEIQLTLNDVERYVKKGTEFYVQLPGLIKIVEDHKDLESANFLRQL